MIGDKIIDNNKFRKNYYELNISFIKFISNAKFNNKNMISEVLVQC